MAEGNKEAHIDENVAEETVEVAETPTEGNDATVEPVQLQINDLQGLGQIINLACKRGASEAAEMETIGIAYNKLNAFLGYVAAQASLNKDGEETNEAPVAETADAPETK